MFTSKPGYIFYLKRSKAGMLFNIEQIKIRITLHTHYERIEQINKITQRTTYSLYNNIPGIKRS